MNFGETKNSFPWWHVYWYFPQYALIKHIFTVRPSFRDKRRSNTLFLTLKRVLTINQ
jgi:hypothetical protein